MIPYGRRRQGPAEGGFHAPLRGSRPGRGPAHGRFDGGVGSRLSGPAAAARGRISPRGQRRFSRAHRRRRVDPGSRPAGGGGQQARRRLQHRRGARRARGAGRLHHPPCRQLHARDQSLAVQEPLVGSPPRLHAHHPHGLAHGSGRVRDGGGGRAGLGPGELVGHLGAARDPARREAAPVCGYHQGHAPAAGCAEARARGDGACNLRLARGIRRVRAQGPRVVRGHRQVFGREGGLSRRRPAVLQLKKLGRDFALEASGVDLAQPLSDAAFREIEEAFFAGQVLVFRAQKFTAREFLEFARRFGPPEPHVVDQFHHPEYADILILSNVMRDGKPAGLADAGTYFHTDYSYLEMPARATLLYSIQVPRAGGDTLFANQYAAYDDLPGATKKRLEGLVGLHHYGNRDDLEETSRTAASLLTGEQKGKLHSVTHPVPRRHPVTGRTALYAVSGSSLGIEGMREGDARALLDELKRHATLEKYRVRLSYGVGDVVIWDNASLLHSATLTDPEDARTLWRITIMQTRRHA